MKNFFSIIAAYRLPLTSYWLLLAAYCILPIAYSHAQGISDPTSWSYHVKKKGTNEYELIFHVELKEGWHIFSQNAGDEFLIPPSFKFKKNGTIKFVGKVSERGKLKTERMEGIDNPINYYEAKADFVQVVKARPGVSISGEHEYQVCNDKMCLPPKKKNFEFVVKD
ncbi:MAG TPA: protein-disulfide reductase DsbD family protein [Flavipsychrobacter sp.]|nr:protein-disulfide reductase DsbD family protein [Flavipsychrobacter sp.]